MTLGPADENIAISGAGLMGRIAFVWSILATGFLLQQNEYGYYLTNW